MALITNKLICSGDWEKPQITTGDGNFWGDDVTIFFNVNIEIRGAEGQAEITLLALEGKAQEFAVHSNTNSSEFPFEIKAPVGTEISILATN